jgi:hypothetical protein
MPAYNVTGPDGRKYRVTAPDGATQDEIIAYAQKNAAPAPAKPPQPEGESNILPNLAVGAREAWDAGAQYLAHSVERVFPGVKPSRESMEGDMRQTRDLLHSTFDPGKTTGNAIARGFGQAGITAPLTPAMKAGGLVKAAGQGGAIGTGAGALTPVYDVPEGSTFWDEKRKQMGISGALGMGLGGAGNAIGKAIAPKLADGARALLDAKIPLTAGQTMGGVAKGIEDRLAGFPLIGDVINKTRREGIEAYNKAIYAKAVEKFGAEGQSLVKQAPAGHEGIKAVGDFLSAKYEAALAQSVPSVLDDGFRRSLNQLHTMVPKTLREDFAGIINQHIVPTPGNTITPSVAKAADSELGRLAASYKGSSVAAEREMSRALAQAQSELRQLFARHNPESAPLIRAADHGWRTITQMEKAGGMQGAKDGVFSPAQFLHAVKHSDKSMRDRQYARGDAWNQKFAEDANRVLPNHVPDSGTTGRAAMGMAAMGMVDMGTTAALTLPYLPGGRQITTGLLSKRPDWAEPLAERVKRASPYLGLLGGPLANQ